MPMTVFHSGPRRGERCSAAAAYLEVSAGPARARASLSSLSGMKLRSAPSPGAYLEPRARARTCASSRARRRSACCGRRAATAAAAATATARASRATAPAARSPRACSSRGAAARARVRARREVILCAGAIGSPQLLQVGLARRSRASVSRASVSRVGLARRVSRVVARACVRVGARWVARARAGRGPRPGNGKPESSPSSRSPRRPAPPSSRAFGFPVAQVSGVGSRAHVEGELGLALVADAPGVGEPDGPPRAVRDADAARRARARSRTFSGSESERI